METLGLLGFNQSAGRSLSVVGGFELGRRDVAEGAVQREVLNQWTQLRVASSTSSTVRHGPLSWISSLL